MSIQKMAVDNDVDEQIQRQDLRGWQFVLGNISVGSDDDWEPLIWNKNISPGTGFLSCYWCLPSDSDKYRCHIKLFMCCREKTRVSLGRAAIAQTDPWALCPNTDEWKDFHRPVISVRLQQCALNLAYRDLSSLYSITSCEGCGCSVNVKAAHL